MKILKQKKNILFLFVILFSVSSCGQIGRGEQPEKQDSLKGITNTSNLKAQEILFKALSDENIIIFKEQLLTREEFAFWVCSKYAGEQNKKCIEMALSKENDSDYLGGINEMEKMFRRSIERGKEIGIVWSEAKLISFSIDSSKADYGTKYFGELYFNCKEKSYIVKYDDGIKIKNKFKFSSIRTPYLKSPPPPENLTMGFIPFINICLNEKGYINCNTRFKNNLNDSLLYTIHLWETFAERTIENKSTHQQMYLSCFKYSNSKNCSDAFEKLLKCFGPNCKKIIWGESIVLTNSSPCIYFINSTEIFVCKTKCGYKDDYWEKFKSDFTRRFNIKSSRKIETNCDGLIKFGIGMDKISQ